MEETHLPQANLTLTARLEALLFVAPGPATPAQLAAALEISVDEVEKGLDELEAIYEKNRLDRGLRLQQHKDKFQLTSAPEAALSIERLLGLEDSSRLSRAALESLAIVAFQQPVTRPQIDAIRGVNSDGVIKTLLSRGLICELGRSEAVGRPILYGTTPEFLQYFGLNSLDSLPPLKLEDESGNVPEMVEGQGG